MEASEVLGAVGRRKIFHGSQLTEVFGAEGWR
jgi:hypothetical protein